MSQRLSKKLLVLILCVVGAMAACVSPAPAQVTHTPTLSLSQIPVGYPNWGALYNANLATIDSAIGQLQTPYQGAWTSGATYSKGQLVSFGSTYYQSLISNNIGNSPSTSPSDWQVMMNASSLLPGITSDGSNGAVVQSTLTTGYWKTKGPRIDVTHPDFGIGCGGIVASSTNSDNTCQAAAAIQYMLTQQHNGQFPCLYFPAGTYKFSGSIRIPTFACVVGDGPQSTVLQETGAKSDLLVVVNFPGYSGLLWNTGVYVGNLTLAGSGSTTTGALFAPLSSPPTLDNVGFYNTAGRGMALYETSERSNYTNLNMNDVRFPIIADLYETRFTNLTMNSPGGTADGHCYTINCPTYVFPAALKSTYTLVSASGNGTTASYVFSGNSGSAPSMPVGTEVYFNGITGTTTLNGYFFVSSTASNSPVSGEFTVTVSSTANGTGTVTGATFGTSLRPEDRHAAIWVGGGYYNRFVGGEMKPMTYMPVFKFNYANADLVSDAYFEGYLNSINAAVLFNGLPDQLVGNGTTSNCNISGTNYRCIPVTADSAQWWPAYIGLASDLPTYASTVTYNITAYIFCADYNPASSAPCAQNPGVLQNQYEIAQVAVANDTGLAYITSGNLSGSTAPSGTMWVNPVIELPGGGASGTGVKFERIHWSVDYPASLQNGYVQHCADNTPWMCGEILTSIDDQYIHHSGGANITGYPFAFGSNAEMTLTDTWGGGNPELTGQGWIKVSSRAMFYTPNGVIPTAGETNEISTKTGNRQLTDSNGTPNIYSTVTGAAANFSLVGTGQQYNDNLLIDSSGNSPRYFLRTYDGYQPAGIGGNPGSTIGMGLQFNDSRCLTGVPTATNQNFRFCVTDYNNSLGPEVVYQTTNNANSSPPTWVTVLGYSPTGMSGTWIANLVNTAGGQTINGAETFTNGATFGSSTTGCTFPSAGTFTCTDSGGAQTILDSAAHFLVQSLTNMRSYAFGAIGAQTGDLSQCGTGIICLDKSASGDALSILKLSGINLWSGSFTTTFAQAAITANRTFTLPDANSNPVQPLSAPPSAGCLGWIDSSGLQHGVACVTFVTSDPSGTCTAGTSLQYNSSDGKLWGCSSGTWAAITSSGTSLPHVDDGVTTPGVVTISEPTQINDGTGTGGGGSATFGTPPTASPTTATNWADTTSKRWEMNNANTGNLLYVGIATPGTPGDCLQLAANGIDLVDSGTPCNFMNGVPTYTADSGLGSSPTVSLDAGAMDGSGWLTVTPGTAPTASAGVVTIVYSGPYSFTPKCGVEPANASAAALYGAQQVYVSQSQSTSAQFVLMGGSTVLTTGTTYVWRWSCGRSHQ